MSEKAKLDLILDVVLDLKLELELFKPDLTIEKEVIHFLAIDRRTFKKYLSDGRLIEGIHFFNENNKKIYVPSEIIKFKKGGCRPPVTNPKAQAVLKKFGL
ncbi:hypothetical protein MLC52_05170 [Sulfurimonas sp. NW15]|uniref:hypothetical protein n=1 Tax=unclassified Sulfurimonas TaxID=2623549 RepID=UPI003DA7A8AB